MGNNSGVAFTGLNAGELGNAHKASDKLPSFRELIEGTPDGNTASGAAASSTDKRKAEDVSHPMAGFGG